MSDDVLLKATQALRQMGEEPGASELTRARIVASLQRTERRRTKMITWLLPVAAVLVVSTGWAAASGGLTRAWHAVAQEVGIEEPAPTPPQTPAPKPRAQAVPAPTPTASEVPSPVESSSSEPQPEPAPSMQVPEPAPVPSSATPPQRPEQAPVVSPRPAVSTDALETQEMELYRTAHRAHFSSRNWSEALDAWNAYLQKAPKGRFTLEARYNRAICLVRLGRTGEAATALRPFAQGTYGGYRQKEAQDLLDAINAEP